MLSTGLTSFSSTPLWFNWIIDDHDLLVIENEFNSKTG